MRIFTLLFLTLLTTDTSLGQVWRKTANVLGQDIGFSVVELEPEGYVALGRGRPDGGSLTYYLVWLDDNGVFQQVVTSESLELPFLRGFGRQVMMSENNTLFVSANFSSNMGYLEFSTEGELLSYAQIPTEGEAIVSQLVLTSDGGKLLVGRRTVVDDLDYDIVTVKIDSQDNIEWTDIYGTEGDSEDQAFAALESRFGGFLIAGGITAENELSEDRFIRKLSQEGVEVWTYLAPITQWDDFVWNMIELEDGSIYTNSRRLFPGNNILEKFTSEGELLWGREFPLNFPNTLIGLKPYDFLLSNDGNLTFSGVYRHSIFIFKHDLDGNFLTAKMFQNCPIGSNTSGIQQDLIQTSDNGYLLLTFQAESLNPPMNSLIFIKTDSLMESFPLSNTQTIQGSICDNFPFQYNDNLYYQPGIYLDHLDYPDNGCDTLVTLIVDQTVSTESSINAQICPGESLIFLGDTISSEGFYEFVIPSGNTAGCDSTINLLVSTVPSTGAIIEDVLCSGLNYILGDSIFTEAGQYQVTLAGENQFGCDSIVILTLSSSPTIELLSVDIADDIGNNSGAILPEFSGGTLPLSYEWSTGDTTQTLTNLAAGEYLLVVMDANGCTQEFNFTVDLINSTQQQEQHTKIEVFPNPIQASDRLFIRGTVGNWATRLYSSNGQLIVERNNSSNDKSISLPYRLQPGVYFLQVTDDNGRNFSKIVVF